MASSERQLTSLRAMLLAAALTCPLTPAAAGQADNASVVVTGDPAECAHSTTAQLWAITTGGARPPSGPRETMLVPDQLAPDGSPLAVHITFIDGQAVGPECRWTFQALPPGDYVALLTSSRGSGGSVGFTLEAGESTTVAIPPPVVRLSGLVFRNGAPVEGAQVRIVTVPFSRPSIIVVTDASGEYTATLDRPGLHEVSADGGSTIETTLSAGSNTIYLVGGMRRSE